MSGRMRFLIASFASLAFVVLAGACSETTQQQNPAAAPQPTAPGPQPFAGNPFTQPMGAMGQPPTQPGTDPNAPPGAQAPVPETPPSAPAAMAAMQQGTGAYVSGDLEAARNFYRQATQIDPASHHAAYALAVVQERLRELDCESNYIKAIGIAPKFEPAIIAYSLLLIRRGKFADAERMLNEKRSLLGRSAAITATLAEVKSLQKDTGSAQRLAQEALKINPDYRPAMVIIARDHYRNRRLDLALYALQAILDGFGEENPARDKENPEAFLLRGLILREQGQRTAAMDQFRKVLQTRPDFVEARTQLATMLLEAGNAQEALMLL